MVRRKHDWITVVLELVMGQTRRRRAVHATVRRRLRRGRMMMMGNVVVVARGLQHSSQLVHNFLDAVVR